MTKFPMPGYLLTTRQYRADATGFVTKTEAEAAIQEYMKRHLEDQTSIRLYRNEGFYVYLQFPAGGARWLTYQ